MNLDKQRRLEKILRRRRAALCHELDLPPDATDAHIVAKGGTIEDLATIEDRALEKEIDSLDDVSQKQLGKLLARATLKASGETRQQVYALLGLGDLD